MTFIYWLLQIDSTSVVTMNTSPIVFLAIATALALCVIALLVFVDTRKNVSTTMKTQTPVIKSDEDNYIGTFYPSDMQRTLKPTVFGADDTKHLFKTSAGRKNKEAFEAGSAHPIDAPLVNDEGEAVVEKVESKKKKGSEVLINFVPSNAFEQIEPVTFPYICMPLVNSPMKKPSKGRAGRTGKTEGVFRSYLSKFFSQDVEIFDDRTLRASSKLKYSPDFTFVFRPGKKEVFIDIEIDEPYEGINDIAVRKPTHFQFADQKRNQIFTGLGWVVIRFAECQIHLCPESCCLVVAHVLSEIDSNYSIPVNLKEIQKLTPVPQWTSDAALFLSRERYRESYLGIESFGLMDEVHPTIETDATEDNDESSNVVSKEILTVPDQLAQSNRDSEATKNHSELVVPTEFTIEGDTGNDGLFHSEIQAERLEVTSQSREDLITLKKAIETKTLISFIYLSGNSTRVVTHYLPSFFSIDILTGHSRQEGRIIEYYIPSMRKIVSQDTVVPSD